METELVVLVNTAAAALVGLMISDSWEQAKGKVTGLLGRGRAADEAAQSLESARAQLMAAPPGSDSVVRTGIEAEWASRFWRLVQSVPGTASGLQELCDLVAALAPGQAASVTNVNYGSVQSGSVIQAGQITGSTLHLDSGPQ